jgi:hypothetical protein
MDFGITQFTSLWLRSQGEQGQHTKIHKVSKELQTWSHKANAKLPKFAELTIQLDWVNTMASGGTEAAVTVNSHFDVLLYSRRAKVSTIGEDGEPCIQRRYRSCPVRFLLLGVESY